MFSSVYKAAYTGCDKNAGFHEYMFILPIKWGKKVHYKHMFKNDFLSGSFIPTDVVYGQLSENDFENERFRDTFCIVEHVS